MNKLSRDDLWSLEEYAERRTTFREAIMAHKKNRQVALGEHARLYFEDDQTIRYQVQEMLRVEKIFEAAGINEELEAYNPLIPDGHNWKATLMLEYTDAVERGQRVRDLKGVELKVWVQVEGCEKVFPICDEDLDREDEERTSTVHFLRFELEPAMITAIKKGATVAMGISHPNLQESVDPISSRILASLAEDLDDVPLN